MKQIVLFSLSVLLFINCNNRAKKPTESSSRTELVPEPDKAERLKQEALQALAKSGCVLTDPDTSLGGIMIRNPESTIAVIGEKDKPDSMDQYHYYSAFDREVLTLTQHAGDGQYTISIFAVTYADKADYSYRRLKTDTFKTGKGIQLGISKKQITEKLGACYAALDSTKDYIELYYQLAAPADSKTSLLATHNMPVYYASYKLRQDKLIQFEFGFEYP